MDTFVQITVDWLLIGRLAIALKMEPDSVAHVSRALVHINRSLIHIKNARKGEYEGGRI